MFIPGDCSADATSNHAEVDELKGDNVLHLVGGQVQLDAVVHLWKRKMGFSMKGEETSFNTPTC